MNEPSDLEKELQKAEGATWIDKDELAERRKPRIPRKRMWTLTLMKINGSMLIFFGALLTFFAIRAILEVSSAFVFVLPSIAFAPLLLFPLSILFLGVTMFRCSKLGIICSCVFALLYMLILFFELLMYIRFARAHPYDAIIPSSAYVLLFIILFQFSAAYILSRSWRYLRWV